MEVDGSFPCRDRCTQEYYNIEHGNMNKYGYHNGDIHLKTAEQSKATTRYEHDMYSLGIIMTHYRLKRGLRKLCKSQRKIPQKN